MQIMFTSSDENNYTTNTPNRRLLDFKLFYSCWALGLLSKVFAYGPGNLWFNPRSSHTKDSKMVLDAILLNTQHYKVRIKGKVEQSRERYSALSPTLRCCSN